MTRLHSLLALAAAALAVAFPLISGAQSNLPLGLPADQLIPVHLDGYRLVTLDRTKQAIFEIDGKRVPVDLPLYVYLPEKDNAATLRQGLKAVHDRLGHLASSREPVDPQELLTLYLAMEGVLAATEPVKVNADSSTSASASSPAPNAMPSGVSPANPLARAVNNATR